MFTFITNGEEEMNILVKLLAAVRLASVCLSHALLQTALREVSGGRGLSGVEFSLTAAAVFNHDTAAQTEVCFIALSLDLL